ncbi:MAG TPA: hydroxysqualene dehydroxylase HpnE [Methyloradius sp.]
MGKELAARVAVIGGGCAGLAAASRLAEKGINVTLYEASPQLGGRARGISWKGLRLDNGQHILLGAYSETLRLLKLAGVDEAQALLRLPLQLSMHEAFELKACPALPAPLHILAGLLRAKGLSWGERFAAIRFMAWMRLSNFTLLHDETLQSLFARKSQPARLVQLLWEPLCLAALNTPLNKASAQVFLSVLRDSFAKKKQDSDMLLPRRDLSVLIADPLAAYIEQQGGVVKTHAPINQVLKTTSGYALTTDAGESLEYSHVIMAVSPYRLSALTSELNDYAESRKLTEELSYQPIYTVYLQYAGNISLAKPMQGLTGMSQWVFDRGQICGQQGLLAVVVSAEGSHQAITQEALAIAVANELAAAFPHLGQPLWHKVIAEKRATFSCDANILRPHQITVIPDLYLAGDYTTGDYPATIEGAVRSGVQCANYIIGSIQ